MDQTPRNYADHFHSLILNPLTYSTWRVSACVCVPPFQSESHRFAVRSNRLAIVVFAATALSQNPHATNAKSVYAVCICTPDSPACVCVYKSPRVRLHGVCIKSALTAAAAADADGAVWPFCLFRIGCLQTQAKFYRLAGVHELQSPYNLLIVVCGRRRCPFVHVPRATGTIVELVVCGKLGMYCGANTKDDDAPQAGDLCSHM